VQHSPSKGAGRPPLPSYSRTSSVASRASNEGSAIAGEGWQESSRGGNGLACCALNASALR
jgi:hypothetical protein